MTDEMEMEILSRLDAIESMAAACMDTDVVLGAFNRAMQDFGCEVVGQYLHPQLYHYLYELLNEED